MNWIQVESTTVKWDRMIVINKAGLCLNPRCFGLLRPCHRKRKHLLHIDKKKWSDLIDWNPIQLGTTRLKKWTEWPWREGAGHVYVARQWQTAVCHCLAGLVKNVQASYCNAVKDDNKMGVYGELMQPSRSVFTSITNCWQMCNPPPAQPLTSSLAWKEIHSLNHVF